MIERQDISQDEMMIILEALRTRLDLIEAAARAQDNAGVVQLLLAKYARTKRFYEKWCKILGVSGAEVQV